MFARMTFVNIIESPSPQDRAVDRTEGKMLKAALDLVELPYTYSLVGNYSEFMQALGSWNDQRVPVIHLSMHGSPEGLVLTDGHFLPWNDLNWKFRLLNMKLQNTLFVCLSSCYGLSGLRMLRETVHGTLQEHAPFRLLVSNTDSVRWSDAAIGFATFYHLMERGKNPAEMVSGMRAASGNDNFFGLLVGNPPESKVLVLGSEQLRKSVEPIA